MSDEEEDNGMFDDEVITDDDKYLGVRKQPVNSLESACYALGERLRLVSVCSDEFVLARERKTG